MLADALLRTDWVLFIGIKLLFSVSMSLDSTINMRHSPPTPFLPHPLLQITGVIKRAYKAQRSFWLEFCPRLRQVCINAQDTVRRRHVRWID
jgi:hypothetical protein